MKIALTIRSFGEADSPARELLRQTGWEVWENLTGRHLDKEALLGVIREADGVVAGTEKFDREVLHAGAGKLKVISRVGVGIDNIDLDAARDLAIQVRRTPQAPSQAVAEHTLALILALSRRLKEHMLNMQAGHFKAMSGHLIAGKTLGIVGLGTIGKRVAQMGQALGLSILFYDPELQGDELAQCLECVGSLGELFARADIITLHASPSKGSHTMINREVLARAKPGLIFINTARGNMVDEEALFHFLEEGRVMGVGLDVFHQEPYSGLLGYHPRVISTPHVASNTVESRQGMELEAVENLIAVLRA
jgi:D-3-phosphoglycerate dehydrogenase / 2-oxoglutarate reductase